MSGAVGILVMAYGTARGPADVERYYTDIRGGRPPSPEHLAELRERYAAIGNRFPLLEITERQAAGLEERLNSGAEPGGPRFRSYLGMKHSPPFVADAVARMREDGIGRAVGLVMAPHWSGMSVQTYVERVERAVAEGGGPAFTFVRQWFDHPAFVEFLASRVAEALDRLTPEERASTAVIFSAHSLPTRELPDGSLRCGHCRLCAERCEYAEQLGRTADLVSAPLFLPVKTIAWQSAGRTDDPWWGPSVEEMMGRLAAEGHRAVAVCPAGFVADHLEILYDLDIEARRAAETAGLAFVRTEMPNDDPRFVEALAAVVREHLAAAPEPASEPLVAESS